MNGVTKGEVLALIDKLRNDALQDEFSSKEQVNAAFDKVVSSLEV